MKIIYMGTPDFAVAPLVALAENGYEVEAVITQPDKPSNLRRCTAAHRVAGQRDNTAGYAAHTA